ncbi:carbon-nitrogen hydrolase family protein [Alteromonas sp. ASW11-36]|uniref:Carbon-nitrogen hydrolase family protein n=1 Tax=Alteromonas arenosi TaxID=3055817 RepID=A0ABT7SUA2_9ALTE|nr:carbon-nitrogen hydrolase family protein [Alteromonas sp. ASW11-36]MDM7859127.1 carbon-nitrogen hydrolase family protein [Alteromonas sp. ASW11-36]
MVDVAAIQLVSMPDVDANFAQVKALMEQSKPGQLVVLPECFAFFGGSDKAQLELAQQPDNRILERLQDIAKSYQCWLVTGTLPVLSDSRQRFRAASFCLDSNGDVRGRYDKIHLFDVSVDDSTGSYLESRYTEPGDTVTVVESPFGRIGMAVCYDIRFPGLFQAMEQIDVLVLPSAFTAKTGQAHWHALLQARSIELQCYVVGANQGGVHANGRETFGHSSIYSPWGEKISSLEQGVGFISGTINTQKLSRIRRAMPVGEHKKFRSYFEQSS